MKNQTDATVWRVAACIVVAVVAACSVALLIMQMTGDSSQRAATMGVAITTVVAAHQIGRGQSCGPRRRRGVPSR